MKEWELLAMKNNRCDASAIRSRRGPSRSQIRSDHQASGEKAEGEGENALISEGHGALASNLTSSPRFSPSTSLTQRALCSESDAVVAMFHGDDNEQESSGYALPSFY
jgi:hypothetical protein